MALSATAVLLLIGEEESTRDSVIAPRLLIRSKTAGFTGDLELRFGGGSTEISSGSG